MTLLETLETRRKALKMTRGAFAKHLDVDPTYYSRALKTQRRLSAGFLLKVQKAFPELIRDTLEVQTVRLQRDGKGERV